MLQKIHWPEPERTIGPTWWPKIMKFHDFDEISKSRDFFQKSRFRIPIPWNFNKIAALRAMFQFISDAGARTMCHVYTYDVFTFYGVSGVVVCGSCLDIINMACRDGFPSRRLVSSNTPLAPSGNLGQAWPVTINRFSAHFRSQLWIPPLDLAELSSKPS